MRQDMQDTRTRARTTCWRVAAHCCTDEGKRRETYRHKEGEQEEQVGSKAKKHDCNQSFIPHILVLTTMVQLQSAISKQIVSNRASGSKEVNSSPEFSSRSKEQRTRTAENSSDYLQASSPIPGCSLPASQPPRYLRNRVRDLHNTSHLGRFLCKMCLQGSTNRAERLLCCLLPCLRLRTAAVT